MATRDESEGPAVLAGQMNLFMAAPASSRSASKPAAAPKPARAGKAAARKPARSEKAARPEKAARAGKTGRAGQAGPPTQDDSVAATTDSVAAPGVPAAGAEAPQAAAASSSGPRRRETAETIGKRQREISVAEFFQKNRHLLGFDNPQKALLTATKEAVDNSLDACEEAGILPTIEVEIEEKAEDRFRLAITDNGPGIVRNQIPKVFGKLLYGSKFHTMRQSRGQQGIGISAAGMYSQLTTGQPVRITSRTG
ncbi:MAG TPA: ATP-binding protein [Candidatus Polarisedimenticolia bacterium]|nr:ATP-binding protein [Candidatus Polarisedimenticolia bacterium]